MPKSVLIKTSDKDEVCIESKSGDDSGHSLKARHYGNQRSSLLYGGFLDSTCTYHKDSVKSPDGDVVELCPKSDDNWIDKPLNCLTDEDLLKACGGRTAHKAARHGLKLNGKLKRIQEQEQQVDTCTASKDKSEEPLLRISHQVQCEKKSRKRKRTRDGSGSKKKKKL